MLDTATLGRALRGAIAIRDRVLVLCLDRHAIETAARLDAVAETIALLRAIDTRPMVLFDAGGLGAVEQSQATRLAAAIVQRGERAVPLAAGGVITVHRLDVATGEVAPDGTVPTKPMFVPIVDPGILGQLTALRYVPIVTLPVVDASGAASDAPTAELALAAAKYLDAAVLAIVRTGKAKPPEIPPASDGAVRTRALVLAPSAVDRLLHEILFDTKSAAPAAAAR